MVKLDIISGFLGAGKTTFVNKLLRYYMDSGLKPVCIVNEFGQTGLDRQIIEADGFSAVELEGGCVCCTLKDDVSTAIIQVIEAFSPTNIVFEPSGIFIFDNFFDIVKSEELKNRCSIGSVVTVVDSVNFSFAKAMYGSFIYNQIKNSPAIALSKLEKSEHQEVESLICDIKNINPDAIVTSKAWNEWKSVDFETLLNLGVSVDEHRANHHSFLKTVTINPTESFTRERFDEFVKRCISGKFGDICRAKGILNVDGERILLNIAMLDVTVTPFRGSNPQTLTLIGNRVKEKKVEKFLGE